MLRVHTVSGPTTASAGDRVVYRVTAFSEAAPTPAETASVSWLVKSADGAALGHFARHGDTLDLVVPQAWAGQTATIMPYLRSPAASISVRTAVLPRAAPRRPGVPHAVAISRDGKRYYCSVDGEPRFYLGSRVAYGQRFGLMNSSNPPGPRYTPQDHEAAHGDWAWYLYPMILAESRGYFSCLNTYDRAAFTFGHIQLAAHTPDDNFVKFFREILVQPAAPDYFPDLVVAGGRIHAREPGGLVPLETSADTAKLMAYLNPTPNEVDDGEAERAARMVDWSMRHAEMREAQVAFAVREQRRKLGAHARKLPLDGVVDKLVIVVLDILHQGRGKYVAIKAALGAADPFDALLGIGGSAYRDRIATLRAAIRDLEAAGRVGRQVFDEAQGEFVVPPGA